MISINNYKDIGEFFTGNKRTYYFAHRVQDDLPVIIKTTNADKVSPIERNQILHEYDLLKKLTGSGLAEVYAVEPYGDGLALIMESFSGMMLSDYIKSTHRNVMSFLKIAISLATNLERIHHHNIIHKDIQPDNILVDSVHHSTQIVDFRFSSLLPNEKPVIMNPAIMEGTLAYMSPEQTGRMSRTMDYRTDLYSLGVVFYKMLTGLLPFTGADPLEVVHGHLAKKPVSPHHINQDVPKIVSDIIIKLLAKNAEERYLSEHGLIEDLKKCRSQYEKTRNIDLFPLAIEDLSNKLRISQKIYGREHEISSLLDMFERTGVGGSTYMTVVSGQPGIGKTSLVQEVFKSITEKKGYFIAGKFDLFHQNGPYNALVQAFEELVKQLLTESESRLAYWKQRLVSVLGSNGRIIIDVIPDMELLIGRQPPVKTLALVETQNRFNRVFMDFIRLCAAPEHPLVIFLDDLQWADGATLNLLEALMVDDRIGHLFLIVSYRDNEVDEYHPLFRMLMNLETDRRRISRIILNPLTVKDTARLIADTLYCGLQAAEPLAEIVSQKTGGNPFFINQFLILIFQRDLLSFNPEQGMWQWNLAAIRELDITENVVDILLHRLELMPEETRRAIMMAACLGSSFDVNTLSAIAGHTPSEMLCHLLPAIEEDLIMLVSCKTSQEISQEEFMTMSDTHRFLHDRIRQAAYALLSDEGKKQMHLKIGNALMKRFKGQAREENIFNIIHQFNMAMELITEPRKRENIAGLNLAAGNKAKSMAAFKPAYNYYTNGLMLLEENSWRNRYDLTLQLHQECAEAARLCGDFGVMNSHCDTVINNGRHALDRVNVYLTRIHALISEDRRGEALTIAREVLNAIGMPLPSTPTRDDVMRLLNETVTMLHRKNIDDLIAMKQMNAPHHLAATKVISQIISPSYQVSPDWFIVLACQQMNLSVRHGHASNSALAYVTLGLILSGYLGDIELGYELGKAGLKLLQRFDAKELKAKIYMGVYAMNHHWKFHLEDTLESLLVGYHSGLETGDFEFASYNAASYGYHALFAGKPLKEVEREMSEFRETFRHIKQNPAAVYNAIFHQTVLNLLGNGDSPARLSGEVYDEKEMIRQHRRSDDIPAMFFMHACKTMLCFMFGDYPEAVKHADMADEIAEHVPGFYVTAVYRFYDSLSRLADFDRLSSTEREAVLLRVKDNQLLMERWMTHAPMNFAHKFYLVEAEQARIRGDEREAMRLYELAIRLSRENRYKNEEALAYETAAIYWMKRNHPVFAAILLQKAQQQYQSWGAVRKASHLTDAYPQLLAETSAKVGPACESIRDAAHGLEAKDHRLDLSTLLKSSQAISGEIVLSRLLCTLMKILIENTGADTGFLVLNSPDGLRLSAQGIADEKEVVVKSYDMDFKDTDKLSAAIVQYVARTREYLVLKNASEEPRFGHDPHIRANQPKSILCSPIIHKSALTGIVYLENRLSPDIFSAERIEVLNLLTSQIAISIENTRLFEEQRRAEEKYRSIFENAAEGILLATAAGRFINANPAAAQILGYSSPEDMCSTVTDISRQVYVSPEDQRRFMRMLRKRETVKDFEVQFRKKNGEQVWVSLNARSIFNDNGELVSMEGFIMDISERKAATEDLMAREEILRRENTLLRSNIKDRYRFGRIIGKSKPMQEVYDLILKAAGTDAPVIVYGESGTGKELVAQAIFETSERKGAEFVPVNCGAIPENLLESEFFGYKKGAFTGAGADKKGFLDLAHNGVLFLDELGEVPVHFQVKLLRALENGSYTPLGSNEVKRSNARVIAATNRDLLEAISQGNMRKDFYYRIHILPIYLPPLRERREDIPLLIEHFISIHQKGSNAPQFTGEMIEAMLSHDWPGNVRELQNVLHRYCTLGNIDFAPNITRQNSAALPAGKSTTAEPGQKHQAVMENIEKKRIIQSLEKFRWNRKEAADYLGIPLRTFYRKLKHYNIN